MEYIEIAKIVNTFGLKGELKMEVYTDFVEERFKRGSFVYIGKDHLKLQVRSFRFHKGFLMVQFEDYEDINLVERFKNYIVYKDLDDIEPLADGYYYRDLKGLDVYVNNYKKGTVIKVESGDRYNFLRVGVDDKEYLVPFLKAFVLNVDLDNKRIDVVDMEGLF